MIGNLFAPLAMKISGGIIAALLLLAGVQTLRLSSANEKLDEARAELAMSEAKHTITRQSLDTLETKLQDMIQAGNLARQGVQDALTASKGETDALRDSAGRIRVLTGDNCETPDEIMKADL